MNLNDDVVYRCLRLGPLHQLHPGRSRSLVRHHYRLHRPPPCVWYVVIFHARSVGFATGKVKATNRTFEDYFVFAITVRNGKLTNIREYVDTQALARASQMDASGLA
jgi:hypothetical protein